uniref:Uncharacterized protein n=1 Tax=Rhizophora mucronata TaxID=61149 RepID=A0A2P2JC48_RHIMU
MGPRKTKWSNLVQVVEEEDDEFHYDVRLARRWKRRCIANQKFKLNSKDNNSTRRSCTELKKVPDCTYIQIDSDNDDDDHSDIQITFGSLDGNDGNDTENAEHNDFFDNVDPDYKLFLENLKKDGKSYFLEVPVVDGILEIITYESEDKQWDGCIIENSKKTRDFPERESLNNNRVLRSSSKRQSMESQSNLRDGMETQVATHNGCSSNTPNSKTLKSTKCCEKNFNMEDESYKIFLNSLKIEGRHIVFLPEGGGKLTYEKDEQSSSDSEVIELDVDSFSGGVKGPFVTGKDSVEEDGDGFLKSSGGNNCSEYRERLMEILRRPFDKREHRDLLNKVSCKRELLGERETRSGKRREYSMGILGKSYLEQHCGTANINSGFVSLVNI